ncbi:hypothetical protein C8R46DRAFT_448588 [Mycena filopes]|nr:hypothetical protein C8R46DRAFT_448588 [Mycena filopes]
MSASFALVSNRQVDLEMNQTPVPNPGRLIAAAHTTLPPEILGEIFMHCLEGLGEIVPNPKNAPLLLCNICRRWREVALSTPRLWSSLAVDFGAISDCHGTQLGVYRDWLMRARKAPVTLFLNDLQRPDLHTSMKTLLSIIVGLSPQWRDVELRLAGNLTPFLFSTDGVFLGKLPLLEKLAISILPPQEPAPDDDSDDTPSEIALLFTDAPRLRHLILDKDYLPVQVPWDQLHKFSCVTITPSSCTRILRNSPNLLDAVFGRIYGPRSNSRVVHPRLQSLTVGMPCDLDEPHLLDSLTAPALKSLVIRVPVRPPIAASFTSFISRSSIQLHSLALLPAPKIADGLIACLKAASSVVHLRISPPNVEEADALFVQLTDHSGLLPKLESFHVVGVAKNPPTVPSVTPSVVDAPLAMGARGHTAAVLPAGTLRGAHTSERATGLWPGAKIRPRRFRLKAPRDGDIHRACRSRRHND